MAPTKKMPAGMRPRDGQISFISMVQRIAHDADLFKAAPAIMKSKGDGHERSVSNPN